MIFKHSHTVWTQSAQITPGHQKNKGEVIKTHKTNWHPHPNQYSCIKVDGRYITVCTSYSWGTWIHFPRIIIIVCPRGVGWGARTVFGKKKKKKICKIIVWIFTGRVRTPAPISPTPPSKSAHADQGLTHRRIELRL